VRICQKSLHPDPNKRYQSAFELRKAIQKFLVQQGYVLDTGHLANLVEQVFEPIREARAAEIRSGLDTFDIDSASVPILAGSSPSLAPITSLGLHESEQTGTEEMVPEHSVHAAPTKAPWAKYAVAGALAAVLIPVGWFAFGDSEEDDASTTGQPADVTKDSHESKAGIKPVVVPPAPVPTTPGSAADPSAEQAGTPAPGVGEEEPSSAGSEEKISLEDEAAALAQEEDAAQGTTARSKKTFKRPRRRAARDRDEPAQPAAAPPPAEVKPRPLSPEKKTAIEPNPYTR
jgi:hypothetical protein